MHKVVGLALVQREYVPARMLSRTRPDPLASWNAAGTPGKPQGEGRREQSVSRFVQQIGRQLTPRSRWSLLRAYPNRLAAARHIRDQTDRESMTLHEQTSFHAPFRSISWVRSSLLLTQWRFRHRPVHRLPFPIETFEFIVIKQPLRPQLPENTCLCPFLKTSMCTTS